jgi:hypothetical protein
VDGILPPSDLSAGFALGGSRRWAALGLEGAVVGRAVLEADVKL